MTDALIRELDTINNVQVALEGVEVLSPDAKKLLAIFVGTNSTVSNEADYEHGENYKEGLGTKAKELVKKIFAWIMEKIESFKGYVKDVLLNTEKVEAEIAAANELLNTAPIFKSEKVTLSPTITGHLAVEGKLDEHFPAKMAMLADVLATMVETKVSVIDLASSSLDFIEKALSNTDGAEVDTQGFEAIIHKYATVGKGLSRFLTNVDDKRSMVGQRKVTQEIVFNNRKETVQDLVSPALPGGYVLSGTLVKDLDEKDIVGNGNVSNYRNGLRTLGRLLETISPELEKIYSAGVTFNGAALNQSSTKGLIEASTRIVNTIKNNRTFNQDSTLIGRVQKTVKRVNEKEDRSIGQIKIEDVTKLLASTVKLIEGDYFKTYRYALTTVRASLRYLSASVEKPVTEPVSDNLRLGAPA